MIASLPRAAPRVVASAVLDIDWVLRELAALQHRLIPVLAEAAFTLVQERAWFDFGYARAADFARERFGRTGRWLYDHAALGERFRCFPALARAATGEDGGSPLGSVAALLVGRVATADDVELWIEHARRMPVRRLREMMRTPPDLMDDSIVVSMKMPASVRVAFEEALALHRAVVGREVGPSDFIEALVAESANPVEEQRSKPRSKRTPGCSPPEGHCFSGAFASPALRAAIACLGRFQTATRGLEDLVRLENEVEIHLGELLAELDDRRAWRELGCSGVAEYGEERLGMSRTAAWRRAAIARRLRQLPVVRRAYLEGAIGIEAAECIERALGPGADVTAQHAWVARACQATVKRLKDDEALAVRERLLQARMPLPADDVTWQRSLRREPGRSSRAVLELGCDLLTKIEMGQRDPDVFLRLRLPVDVGRCFAATFGEVRRRVSGPLPSGRIAEVLKRRHRGVPAWLALLAMLEDYVRTWDPPSRVRGSVYEREGYRCAAPGCTSRRNLEKHHIEYRSRGGNSASENLICLCRMHHQHGEHGGRAQCRGRAPLDVVWRLGLPHLGTWFRNERMLAREAGPAS